jgi:hypothetical protein
VPVVGSVSVVAPVEVRVTLFAPEKAIVADGIVNVPVVVDTVKPLIVLFVRDCDVAVSTKLTVPVVGIFNVVAVAEGKENVKLADGNVTVVASVPAKVKELLIVRVFEVVPPAIENPIEFEVKVKPLIVLFVNACDEERSTRVTVPDGIVAFVVPVDVRVRPKAPEVVNEDAVVNTPPVVIFPPKFTVLAASFNVRVNVLPAVRFSVFARVRSNAPVPVERIPREVIAVWVPPLIVGDVKVLADNVSVPASVARVPVVGSVTLVEPVVVRVTGFAPEVEKLPLRFRFPLRTILLEAFATSIVTERPAVKAKEEVAAKVTSNAAEVSLIASVDVPVIDAPVIVGDVKVLFVKVCVALINAKVSVVATEGIVIVPVTAPV